MVKLAHTVFALPFALSGATLAARLYGITWTQVAWIVVAMLGPGGPPLGRLAADLDLLATDGFRQLDGLRMVMDFRELLYCCGDSHWEDLCIRLLPH